MKVNRIFGQYHKVFAAFLFIVLAGGFNAASAGTNPALAIPAGMNDDGHNEEGIMHYNKADWDKAAMHFEGSIKSNPKIAEAHYNLALALDKLGRHHEATKHFGAALKLGSDNPDIKNSGILKKHLGM